MVIVFFLYLSWVDEPTPSDGYAGSFMQIRNFVAYAFMNGGLGFLLELFLSTRLGGIVQKAMDKDERA